MDQNRIKKYFRRTFRFIPFLYLAIVLFDLLLYAGDCRSTSIMFQFYDVNIALIILGVILILRQYINLLVGKKWNQIILLTCCILLSIAMYGMAMEILAGRAIRKAHDDIDSLFSGGCSLENLECEKNIEAAFFEFRENYDASLVKMINYSFLSNSYLFLVEPKNSRPFIVDRFKKDDIIIFWVYMEPSYLLEEKLNFLRNN